MRTSSSPNGRAARSCTSSIPCPSMTSPSGGSASSNADVSWRSRTSNANSKGKRNEHDIRLRHLYPHDAAEIVGRTDQARVHQAILVQHDARERMEDRGVVENAVFRRTR